jgi:hypothetical protein
MRLFGRWLIDKPSKIIGDSFDEPTRIPPSPILLHHVHHLVHDRALVIGMRARAAVNADYAAWQERPSDRLIDVASLARELWLFADLQTSAGKAFWATVDGPPVK